MAEAAKTTREEALSEIEHLTDDEIRSRLKMFENNIKEFKRESKRLDYDYNRAKEDVEDNLNKIKKNKQLPWLVSNVVEILDLEPEVNEEGAVDLDEIVEGKALVIKTSRRDTIFLPVPGLVDVFSL